MSGKELLSLLWQSLRTLCVSRLMDVVYGSRYNNIPCGTWLVKGRQTCPFEEISVEQLIQDHVLEETVPLEGRTPLAVRFLTC
jgi:hypothetical protein